MTSIFIVPPYKIKNCLRQYLLQTDRSKKHCPLELLEQRGNGHAEEKPSLSEIPLGFRIKTKKYSSLSLRSMIIAFFRQNGHFFCGPICAA